MRSERIVRRPELRCGFTLIELLVVISIIAVLMSLILPAIQNAREAARRTQCLNNLKNIGLAAHNYAGVHAGRFPAYGYFSSVTTASVELRSWRVELLPYLDQQGVYDRWNKNVAWHDSDPANAIADQTNVELSQGTLAVFSCPDDPSANGVAGGATYVANAGFGDGSLVASPPDLHNFMVEPFNWNDDSVTNGTTPPTTDPPSTGEHNADQRDAAVARDTGVMWADYDTPMTKDPSQTLHTIYDGAANTILISENLNAGVTATGRSWANPDPRAAAFVVSIDVASTTKGFADLVEAPGTIPFINQMKAGPEGTPYLSSNHPGGVNYVDCEGGARFLAEDTDTLIYKSLITPAATRLRNNGNPVFESEKPLGSEF